MPDTLEPEPRNELTEGDLVRLERLKSSLSGEHRNRVGTYFLSEILPGFEDVRCCYCDRPEVSLCDKCFELVLLAKAPDLPRALLNLYSSPCNFCGQHVNDGAELCEECRDTFIA